MITFIRTFTFLVFVASCSNTHEMETGEIKVIEILREQVFAPKKPKIQLDSRKIITRKQIDSFNIPILFVELESGQNGTLTLYPGRSIGNTWLGADGATITFEDGVLMASRGMGDDMMGGTSSKPTWSRVISGSRYKMQRRYLNGNNQAFMQKFTCEITKINNENKTEIFNTIFLTNHYQEKCSSVSGDIINDYYIDRKGIVRKSRQYHGASLKYIKTERLDR